MSKYSEKLATQSFVENSIDGLMKTINNPDEAIEAGVYKVIDDDTIVQFDAYILIVQVKDDSFPIRQTKLTSDGMTYSREFNQFDPPYPEFTQSTVSQTDMALFKSMVDSQFTAIEDELEKQRIITSAEGDNIALSDSSENSLNGLRLFGKTIQAGTPSINNPQPLNSVGDNGSVDVNVYGKNLFNPSIVSCDNVYNAEAVGKTTNSYGTTINSTDYDGNKIVVTQLTMSNTTNIASYTNGFFVIGLYNNVLKFNEEYTFVADYKMTNNLGTSKDIHIGINGASFTKCTFKDGKLYYKFVLNQLVDYPQRRFIEVRCCGKSFELSNIMIIEGNAVDTTPIYEPYKEQTLAINTPNGLPAVPVSSDGNYTDESGQQWICDEIDYNRGVYIKRVGEWRYTGGDLPYMAACITRPSGDILYFNIRVVGVSGKYSGYKNALCNSFITGNVLGVQNAICITPGTNDYLYFSIKASDVGVAYGDGKTTDELKAIVREWMQNTFSEDNPLIAKYPLLEPTETPLSEDEINAHKALHTHYPNTSIHNSDNAHMAVDYVADTKNYVDNKIKKEVAELTAAILTQ